MSAFYFHLTNHHFITFNLNELTTEITDNQTRIRMYPFKNNHIHVNSLETDNSNSTQWPLNQAAYQNVANDQVDWAALAQQWIYMKETCTTDDLLTAPPPPIISKPDFQDEKGEAPMEVEREDEQITDFPHASVPAEAQPNWQDSYPPTQQQQPWRKSRIFHELINIDLRRYFHVLIRYRTRLEYVDQSKHYSSAHTPFFATRSVCRK